MAVSKKLSKPKTALAQQKEKVSRSSPGFSTYKASDGSVTVTRKGSGYDTGSGAGNSAVSSTIKFNPNPKDLKNAAKNLRSRTTKKK